MAGGAGGIIGEAVVDTVRDLFDIGEATGNDQGSSRWESWGHRDIRGMLDNSVDPEDVDEVANEWDRSEPDGFATFADDLDAIVSNGWRGQSADAAMSAGGPIRSWGLALGDAVQSTQDAMNSGRDAGEHARREVPPPVEDSWTQGIGGGLVALASPVGGVIAGTDAVLNDRRQNEAHQRAIDVMNAGYSPPVGQASAPTYPELVDPTVPTAEPSPDERRPGDWGGAPGTRPGGSADAAGGSGHSPPGGSSVQPPPGLARPSVPGPGDGTGGDGSAPGAVIPPPAVTPGQMAPGTGGGPGVSMPSVPSGGGQGGPPAGGGGSLGGLGFGPGGGASGARSGFGGQQAGASGLRGPGGSGAPGSGGFGPRGPGMGGSGAGGVGAGGRGGAGGMPMGAGGGRGRNEDDYEHERPSWLIETEDFFSSTRVVASAVIGEESEDEEQ